MSARRLMIDVCKSVAAVRQVPDKGDDFPRGLTTILPRDARAQAPSFLAEGGDGLRMHLHEDLPGLLVVRRREDGRKDTVLVSLHLKKHGEWGFSDQDTPKYTKRYLRHPY